MKEFEKKQAGLTTAAADAEDGSGDAEVRQKIHVHLLCWHDRVGNSR